MRAGGEKRGSATDRRRRKANLLARHGDGLECQCAWCGDLIDWSTLEQDRVEAGGRYTMPNLVPACRPCNESRGATPATEFAAALDTRAFAVLATWKLLSQPGGKRSTPAPTALVVVS